MARSRIVLAAPNGELWQGMTEHRKSESFGRQFMVVFPDVLAQVASDRTAPNNTVAVLVMLWSRLSPDRWGLISQREVAEAMGVSDASVSRAMSALVAHGLIEKRGAGPRTEWRLVPEAGWKGGAGAYQKAIRERGRAAAAKSPAPTIQAEGVSVVNFEALRRRAEANRQAREAEPDELPATVADLEDPQ